MTYYDETAEKALLGVALLAPKATAPLRLTEADFHHPVLRWQPVSWWASPLAMVGLRRPRRWWNTYRGLTATPQPTQPGGAGL